MHIEYHTFAVVPIFVNTGAAALPAVLAAVASAGALLFKPRALLQVLRRRWRAASLSALGVVALVVAVTAICRPNAAPRRGQPSGALDWVKVAQDIIAQQKVRGASTALAGQNATSPAVPGGGRNSAPSANPGGSAPRGLNPLWSFKPESTLFLSTPVIFGKRVYVAGCQSDLGGYTGLIACLDLDTGKPLWQTTDSGDEPLRAFFSSPAVTADGKYVVIGQGLHTDRDCSLLCFDAASGRQLWAVKTPLHIESSPAIFGDMAVAGAGAIEGEDGKAVGDPGFVLGVRISDGKLLWKQPVNDAESSPVIDEAGMVFIGSGCNGQAVLAIRSGTEEELQKTKVERLAWRTPLTLPMLAPVALVGNVIIAAGGNGDVVHSARNPEGRVVALDKQSGKVLWQTKLDDAVLGKVGAENGVLLCPVRNGEVVALAMDDGHILWRMRISGTAPVIAGCTAAPGHAYVVSNDGYLAVLALSDGKVLEKVYLNDQGKPGNGLSVSTPRIVGNRLIVGSETGGLRCLQGSGGAK